MSGIYRGPNSSVAAQFVNADGDKGDIVVSNAGDLWTIDSGVVTYSKMQNVSANSILGRSATSGQIEEIPCTAFARAILDDTDASSLQATLGYGSIATQSASAVNITGGNISGITDLSITDGGTGASDAAGARSNLGLDLDTLTQKTSGTGSAILPSSTTANRDGSPAAGYLRFNTTLTQFEGYNGTTWGAVGGGATGGAGSYAFYENDQTITSNYTITTGKNAMSAGAITIADGVTITIPDNSTWTIV